MKYTSHSVHIQNHSKNQPNRNPEEFICHLSKPQALFRIINVPTYTENSEFTTSMAAAIAITVENPRNLSNMDSAPTTKDASSNIPATSSESGADKSMGKFEEVAAKTSDVNGSAAVTDIQKKMKRAERFGMSVKLTEQEKRNTRAERFGTGTTVNGSDSSKKSEELKRKARAERFGAVKIASADEEAKKKARLARFGSISQPDSVEEDKKKARAIRFSEQSSSVSNEKGTKNIEEEAVITGEAGVGT